MRLYTALVAFLVSILVLSSTPYVPPVSSVLFTLLAIVWTIVGHVTLALTVPNIRVLLPFIAIPKLSLIFGHYAMIVRTPLYDTALALALPSILSAGLLLPVVITRTRIPRELRDAYRLDGARQWLLDLHLTWPVIVVTSTLAVHGMLSNYLWQMLVLSQHTTIPLEILQRAQSALRVDRGKLLFMSLLLSLPVLTTPFIARYYSKEITYD